MRWFNLSEKQIWLRILVPMVFMFAAVLTFGLGTHLGILGVVGVTTLTSSVCTMVLTPTANTHSPKNLIGGYCIGMLAGLCCYYLSRKTGIALYDYLRTDYHVLFASAAVGLTLTLMLLTKIIHAPAVGLSLAIVIEPWDPTTILIIAIYVLVLSVLRLFLYGRLENVNV